MEANLTRDEMNLIITALQDYARWHTPSNELQEKLVGLMVDENQESKEYTLSIKPQQ